MEELPTGLTEFPGIGANFAEAGLQPPESLILGDAMGLLPQSGSDQAHPLPDFSGGRYRSIDAIVTDPPYGNMEGRGGAYLPLGERVAGLVAIASYRLKVGGRLVFLLPVRAGSEPPELVRPDGCMRIEAVRRNPVSIRMDRLVVVMTKTRNVVPEDLELPACIEDAYP